MEGCPGDAAVVDVDEPCAGRFGELGREVVPRYEKSAAKTDYLEFEGRPHPHMVAPDWQEVAQAIDSWRDGVLDAPLETMQERSA